MTSHINVTVALGFMTASPEQASLTPQRQTFLDAWNSVIGHHVSKGFDRELVTEKLEHYLLQDTEDEAQRLMKETHAEPDVKALEHRVLITMLWLDNQFRDPLVAR